MKTTLNIPDDVALAAKRAALEQGTTFTQLVVRGLTAQIRQYTGPTSLPVSTATGGLVAGVRWEEMVAADSDSAWYR